jgi:hypothetical protein
VNADQQAMNYKVWGEGNWQEYCRNLLHRAEVMEMYAVDMLKRAQELREITKWERPQ